MPARGVLEAVRNAIPRAAPLPTTAVTRPPGRHHDATKSGISETQKQPATIGCGNGPWQRSFPSRISVISGAPNTWNRFRRVWCSKAKARRTGTATQAKVSTARHRSRQSRTSILNRKYIPIASKLRPRW
jgi:hypothetical protein